jgi:hypothetical protein
MQRSRKVDRMGQNRKAYRQAKGRQKSRKVTGWRQVGRLYCNENPICVFLFWELRGLSPNFHIHVSVSDLIFPGRFFPQDNRQILEIDKSLTDKYMGVGTGRQNIIVLFWKGQLHV